MTIYDQQPYFTNQYRDGADGASAYINKITRFSYGKEREYQRLALEASSIWDEWNKELGELQRPHSDALPPGLRAGDQLWFNCGSLRMSDTDAYGDFEIETLKSLEKDGGGLRERQFECGNPDGISIRSILEM